MRPRPGGNRGGEGVPFFSRLSRWEDLVSCYAEIRRRGQTSITVHVIAEACRQLEANLVNVVADATLVYVALGDDGRPRHLREISRARSAH